MPATFRSNASKSTTLTGTRRVRFEIDHPRQNPQHVIEYNTCRHTRSSDDIRIDEPKYTTHRVEVQIPVRRSTKTKNEFLI